MSDLLIETDSQRPMVLKVGGEFDVYTSPLLTKAWCVRCSLEWRGRKAGIEARKHTRQTGHVTLRISGQLDRIALREGSPLPELEEVLR